MNSSVEGVFGRHPQFFICILIANIVIWNVTETDRDQKCMDGLRIAGSLKSKTKTKQNHKIKTSKPYICKAFGGEDKTVIY